MRIFIFFTIVILLEVHIACSGKDSAAVSGQGSQNNASQSQSTPASTADATGFDDPRSAATDALSTLKPLLTEGKNFKEMGFDSLEQIDRASLGEPASVFAVGLDQLRDYSPSSDPQSLLIDTKRMVFPVVADGSGRTLITVEQKDGKWHFVSFGDQRVANHLMRVREEKSSAPGGLATSKYFLIQVKALFLTFLGNQQPGGAGANSLRLVPLNGKSDLNMSPAFRENKSFLMHNPEFNAEEAGTMKAKDVFGALATSAKSIDSSKPF